MYALEVVGLDCVLYPGDGAFYGPKLELVLRGAIGRDWQCDMLQAVPYLLVLGDREIANNEIAVHSQSGDDLGTMSIDDLIARLQQGIETRPGEAVTSRVA